MKIFLSRKWFRLAAISILVIIGLILAIFQPWSRHFSPDEILAQANSAQAEIQSYRMKYSGQDIKEGGVTVADAVSALPTSYRLTLSLEDWVGEYITIGQTRYEKETGTPISSGKQVIFFSGYIPDVEATIDILEQLSDVEVLPDQDIDGRACYHLKGGYNDAPSIEDLLANSKSKLSDEQYQQLKEKLTMEQETTTVEYLISKDDFIIRKVQYTTSSQESGITHTETLTFFDFNQPITVEPPLDGQGNLLPGWQIVTSYGSQ